MNVFIHVPITLLTQVRHWSVFLAGTIMLLVFWVITPLQSAIFNTATITRSISTPMITSADLVSIEQQVSALNANFQNAAYAIAWLGQAIPAFTASKYAVLPFQPSPGHQTAASLETWTTDVDAFSTTLSCSPALVNVTPIGYTFSNDRGCVVPEVNLAATAEYVVNYIGYYDNAQVDWSLQNPNCSTEFSNNFLALWASNSSFNTGTRMYSNLTALFCETAYATTKYKVTVNSSDLAIVSGSQLEDYGSSSASTNISSVFNTTAFEYILATGVNPVDQALDYPSRAILQQDSRLVNYSISMPFSDVVGFAVALNPGTVEALSNPAALQDAFQSAHQLLFATAFTSLLNSTSPSQPMQISRPGIVDATVGAIILVRPVAIVVEIAFGLVAIVAGVLWVYSHRRVSHLHQDPASLADMMAIYKSGRLSPATFDLEEKTSKHALVKVVTGKTYHLMSNSTHMNPVSVAAGNSDLKVASGTPIPLSENAPSISPLELRWYMGVVFVSLILLSILGLAFLNYKSHLLNGVLYPGGQ
jgi:hypothetical protein